MFIENVSQVGPGGRTVGYETNPEFFTDLQSTGLRHPLKQRIFRLQRRNRMHGVSAADGCGRCLGQSVFTDLSFRDQILKNACDILDRNGGVDTMLVEQIDVIGPQPSQRPFQRPLDAFGPAVPAIVRPVVALDLLRSSMIATTMDHC